MAGGWKGNPNSIAALMKHRLDFGHPARRQCARCGKPAMRGEPVCWQHSRHARPGRDTPGRLAARMLAALATRGLLPAELTSLPLWQATPCLPSWRGDPLRLRLAMAWDSRDSEPLAWFALWREATEAVREAYRGTDFDQAK